MARPTRLVPRRAGWMPWRYDISAARFLSRVQFPVFGLAAPPTGSRMLLGGRGEGGSAAVGTRIRSAPAMVELIYEVGGGSISVRTQVAGGHIRMGGVARPDAAVDEDRDIRVDGRGMAFEGWGTRDLWQGEAAVEGLLVSVAIEAPIVTAAELATMTDLRAACRAGEQALTAPPVGRP